MEQKDIQQEATEGKSRLISIQKFLAKKSKANAKLTASEYAKVKQSIKASNSLGLRLIEKQEAQVALELLKQAENTAKLFSQITEQTGESGSALKLLTNTYINIGYLYSQAEDLENAYKYLIKTLEAQERGDYSNQKKGLTCFNLANTLISNIQSNFRNEKV